MAAEQKVLDLKIGDYLVDVEPTDHMDYQQALVVAMKKEKKAFKMYIDLAGATDDANLTDCVHVPRARGSKAQTPL